MSCGEMNGPPGAPQPDTLMFLEYARAAAGGHAYEFTPGAGVSTGSSSHLYPVLLAVCALLHGDALALGIADFILNAVFYLLVAAGVWLIAVRVERAAAGWGGILALSSGVLAYAVLGRTDMGLFTFVVTALLVAAVWDRAFAGGILLGLAAWSRPEGLLLGLAVSIVAVLRHERRWLAAGIFGLLNVAAVAGWNWVLTGTPLFQSLLRKGYFVHLPVSGALAASTVDFARLVVGMIFGLGSGREVYALPLVTGAAALGGLFLVRSAAGRRVFSIWGVAAAGALLLNAAGGWQGYQFDRHLAWLWPGWLAAAACGLSLVHDRRLRMGVGAMLVGYQLVTFPFFVAEHAEGVYSTALHCRFARALDARIPQGDSVGVLNYPGLAFCMPGRRLVHLGGYVSPRFAGRADVACNIEILRREPATRPDVLVFSRSEEASALVRFVRGPEILRERLVFPEGLRLEAVRADWSLLDGGRGVQDPEVLQIVSGRRLVDGIDIGYRKDEQRHECTGQGWSGPLRLGPVVMRGRSGGEEFVDVGRVFLTSERFRAALVPEREVVLVLRTAAAVTAPVVYHRGLRRNLRFDFASPLHLEVLVDGVKAAECDCSLKEGSLFTEAAMRIPARAVKGNHPWIEIVGQHAAFEWWLYQ